MFVTDENVKKPEQENAKPQTTTSTSSDTSSTESSSIFSTGTEKEQLSALYDTAKKKNAEDKTGIHALTHEEYTRLCQIQYEMYGIRYDAININSEHTDFVQEINAMIGHGSGKSDPYYDQMAASYDSVLDVVLDERFKEAMDTFEREFCEKTGRDFENGGFTFNWDYIMKHYATRLLNEYNISIVQTAIGCFQVSLVDNDGNVIQDENGCLAQVQKRDIMIPDGVAQRAELNCSALLDTMGYDIISNLDFNEEEWAAIQKMARLSNDELSKLGVSSGIKAGTNGGSGYRGKSDGAGGSGTVGGLDSLNGTVNSANSKSQNGSYINNNNNQTGGSDASEKRTLRRMQIAEQQDTIAVKKAQRKLNEYVEDLVKKDKNTSINDATKEASKKLHIEDLKLEYTGYLRNVSYQTT